MFRAFHNEDGTLSVFRVGCLTVACLCFLGAAGNQLYAGHGAGFDGSDLVGAERDSRAEQLMSEQRRQEQAHAQELLNLRAQQEHRLKSRRLLALDELAQSVEFLRACGVINRGFIGCNYSFTSEFNRYYDSSIAASEEGFSVTVEAKGEQRDDKCVVLEVTSDGTASAYDAQGNSVNNCYPQGFADSDAVGQAQLQASR
ncbi:MAG: hypothetical protein IJ228_10225 [Succinivibrio sp.]|nr:hypothetical protein [Succinivibrio sp.]